MWKNGQLNFFSLKLATLLCDVVQLVQCALLQHCWKKIVCDMITRNRQFLWLDRDHYLYMSRYGSKEDWVRIWSILNLQCMWNKQYKFRWKYLWAGFLRFSFENGANRTQGCIIPKIPKIVLYGVTSHQKSGTCVVHEVCNIYNNF